MTELFNRSFELEVLLEGIPGFRIDSSIKPALDISFNVTRTMTREPNTAEISVFNLNPSNRSSLEVLGEAQVELKAGYGDDNGVIFRGDVEINNQHVVPDWISFFEADDGGKAIRFDRVNLSFAGGTSLAKVIEGVAKQMRVGIGNTVSAALQGNLLDAGKEFLNGVTVSGPAAKQLNRLTKSSGLEWSIQNDQLQILEKGAPLPLAAVLLTETTGLVGAPQISNKNEVTFRSLMNKDIVPGVQIRLESQTLTGNFRAEKCTYTGQAMGQDWYIDVEAKPI